MEGSEYKNLPSSGMMMEGWFEVSVSILYCSSIVIGYLNI